MWAPDGQSIVYVSANQEGIYRQSADGTGEPELLLRGNLRVTDVSRAGVVAFTKRLDARGRIGTLRLEDKSVSEFVALGHMAAFSPDGKWLAYASNESGEFEVYVRPYPRAPGIGKLVSVGGGTGPVWAPDGATLYYRGASGDLMAVATTLTPGFSPGRPRSLFRFGGRFRISGNAAAYDIHPDGKRFVMVSEPATPLAQPRQINIVQNWHEELKRLVPAN